MRKSVNGLKRPLAMALAAALMVTAVPADVAFAAPAEQETVVQDESPAAVEETAEDSGEEVAAPVETQDVQEETTPEEPQEEAEDAEAPAAPAEEVTDPEAPTEEEAAAPETPAEDVTEAEAPAEEETVEPEAPAEEETETPAEEATESEAPAEEETTAPEEAAAETEEEVVVTEKETEEAQMSAEKPATPALTMDKYNENLYWTPVSGAKKYEIEVTDGTYSYYRSLPVWDAASGKYTSTGYYSMSKSNNVDQVEVNRRNLRYLQAAKPTSENAYEWVEDDKGNSVYADVAGTSYTYKVRAVNQIVTYDADKKEYVAGDYVYGDWSNAVSYTTPKAELAQITNLKFAEYKDDLGYVFTFTSSIPAANLGTLQARICKDDKFEEGEEENEYVSLEMSTDGKWYLDKEDYDYVLGKYSGMPVFIKVYHMADGEWLKDAAGNTVYSNTVSFNVQPDVIPTVPKITGLKVKKESSSGYTFTFDPVINNKGAKYNTAYELQYSKDPAFPKDGYQIADSYYDGEDGYTSTFISYGSLEADTTYYVRAVAYAQNYRGHYENGQWIPNPDGEANGYRLYGAPSDAITIMRKAEITAISNLKLAETTQNSFLFTYKGTIAKNESIEVQISSKSNFPAGRDTIAIDGRIYGEFPTDTVTGSNSSGKLEVAYDAFGNPGTYYVRARVVKDYPDIDSSANEDTMEDYAFSDYTKAVKVSLGVSDAALNSKDVTSNSVTLVMGTTDVGGTNGNEELWSGYELQKKVGKSWKKLAKTTDNNYVDNKLEKDVEYSYRARAFYRNNVTGKTSYGEWAYLSVTTWGAPLNLYAESASATSVKLTWNKVKGAEGYEVYRLAGSSYSSEKEYGKKSDYSKYQLVKTLGSKTASYTDKKLKKNEYYTYRVRAYKTVNGKKFFIESNPDKVALKFGAEIEITSKTQAANGKVTVTWKKVASAKGYLIEKWNPDTEKYVTVKKITKNSTTKYTLPAVKNANRSDRYRIRAYMSTKNGSTKVTEYSKAAEVMVDTYLSAPTSVKAVAQKDGSVKVTWKKVKGADYYQVYRTTSSSYTYNKSTKEYSNASGTEINVYKADKTSVYGYSKVDEEDVTGTSIVDRSIKYTDAKGVERLLNSDAPRAGYTYYYYVVAVKKAPAEEKNVNSGRMITSAHSKSYKATVTNTTVATPKSVKVKAAKGKVTVSWKVDKSVAGYEVLRSTKKNGTYEVVGTVSKATTKSYVDKTAKAGKTYYYKVRAVKPNEAGADSYSAESTALKVKAK